IVVIAVPSTLMPSIVAYTLSLHDALPICFRHIPKATRRLSSRRRPDWRVSSRTPCATFRPWQKQPRSEASRYLSPGRRASSRARSEEHTSELQSPYDLVCRLLLEKKKCDN